MKNTKKQITMHFGGGALYLKCHKCGKEIGFRDVNFPGTPEQQKQPRKELEEIRINHLESCQSLPSQHLGN